jgi:hypothetical protein
MLIVVNAQGRFWDGTTWAAQGKEFLSIAAAIRSLHEEGEDLDKALIVSSDLLLLR